MSPPLSASPVSARAFVALGLALAMTWAPQPAQAAACTQLTSQRSTAEPPGTGRRVVFVYVVPAGAADERLDVPSACDDGTFKTSTMGAMYRDISVWMAKQLSNTTGSRRLTPVTKSYRNPYTGGSERRFSAVFVTSPEPAATWDCRGPSEKLAALRKLLASKGMSNTNSIYAVLLQAKQTCTSLSAAGAGYLGTAGTTYGLGYVLRSFYAGGGSYVRARFGCANYSGDAVMAHEILHVLGGVPLSAPSSDGRGHIVTDHDVLEAMLDGPFLSSSGSPRVALDAGAADYRNVVLGKGWDTTGYSASTSYRSC